MKSVLAIIAALGLATSSALAQSLLINTPTNPVVCEPVLITWGGGSPPYDVSILPGNQQGAAAILAFNATSATSVTWLVDVAAGTTLQLFIRDNSGATDNSANFPIGSGPVTNCVGSTTSFSFGTASAAGGATSAPATGATTTPQSSNTATNSPSSANPGASAGTSATASPSSTKSAGASRVTGQIAAAGIIGAAMVALLG